MDNLTAVAQPPATISIAKLFKMAFDGQDLKPLHAEMLARVQSNPLDAAAVMNLCTIEQLLGNQASGLKRQSEALAMQRLYRSSWPASPEALRVLAFMAPGDIGTNTPIDFLLQDQDVVLNSLYVVPGQPFPDPLPDHDVAIVIADDSDRNRPVLQDIDRLISSWPCPVLNRPNRIPRLSREQMYSFLQPVPGLVMPPTIRVHRAVLEKLALGSLRAAELSPVRAPGLTFPLIARPVDSHAGTGLGKIEDASALSPYLGAQNESEFFLSPFIDYRSSDGLFRKYRILWVDGRPYPCHMAIAEEWKLWYYNAHMAASAAKRAEEARFMTAFDEGFGRRHARALTAIVERSGLEYMGIDCAELPDGRLLVFEGSICLAAHDMDPPDIYPYKSPQMRKLFAGFLEMLKRKSMLVAVTA
jgi:hypothetical protein